MTPVMQTNSCGNVLLFFVSCVLSHNFICFLLSILYEAVEAHEGHGHKARHEEAYREALELIRYM